jgi:2-polyprenyl-3-methyl-5-hydroxy-6-metoxy-1,4-benzoquinol methylase
MMNLNKHKICLICESDQLKKLDRFTRTALLKCKSCGFVFCEKIPSGKELAEYYAHYGTSQYLSPVTVKRYHEWLDYFEKFKSTGNILDVGCANGLFLREAKKRGWTVYGSEYGDIQVEICSNNGIIMHQGPLNDRTFENMTFDVVTSIEVIEHINNPREDIAHIHRLLRKGGLFFCTTPNFNALARFYLGDHYNIINYPEHLSYYTPKTIHNLLKRDFAKIKTTTTGFSFTRFNQSTGRKKQAVVSASSDDELLRQKIEKNRFLQVIKSLINAWLQLFGIGSSLKTWYVKK